MSTYRWDRYMNVGAVQTRGLGSKDKEYSGYATLQMAF